ncbi:hypothetical protein [Amycolatopsis methanolica]|uniref:Uncharacterized protein n=1 Tax=Amycolatopsis methanolica 239 TaxID=1068978 RepID=A0A076N1F3_AMYME|nr:hypothetical protein [Amycolatopsis methanolica]AIJ23727.1 hypothetical protein AMETH_3635 [Amycolatopsis methanolica 239]
MKIALALRELHRAEKALVRDLLKMSDRHHAEPEIHHVARDLARWSRDHVRALADAGRPYGLELGAEVAERSGPLAPVRTAVSELLSTRPEPGVLLLADLRRLHRACAGCRWTGNCWRRERRPSRTTTCWPWRAAATRTHCAS